jgi:hypothetical protein
MRKTINVKTKKQLEKWIDEGSSVAVYKNVDLGHYELGRMAFLKVGKKATYKKAPERMPDSPAMPIAWRYRLQKVVRKKSALEKVS